MLTHEFPGWAAAFSDRDDGDLRVTARTAAQPVEEVQAHVLELLGLTAIAVGHQVHGSDVVVAREEIRGYVVGLAQADAVATARNGIATAVHVADCVPVAVGGVGGVAMLHCGWRGLAGGIIPAGVSALRALGLDGELQGVVGPGAGGCCYETGDEVRELFAAHGAASGRLLDLKAVAAAQLRDAGVVTVADVGRCTICDERYFSHRREGADTGRQGGFAWLR